MNEVFIFGIGGAEWALPAHQVRQVLPAGPVTRLPGASPPLRGLVAWRAQVLPLFVVGKNAGHNPSISDRVNLLVIEVEGELAALAVDRVQGFASSRPLAADTAGNEKDGAVLVDGKAVRLLDLERALNEPYR